VAAAEVALEGAQQELAVGERITLDVLDAERELLEAQLGQVDAERAAYLASHDLLAAMGEPAADASITQLPLATVLQALAPWLASPAHPKTLQNAKYDRLVLLRRLAQAPWLLHAAAH
jgi:DNA polymerase I-like protein with 3'-5' exonuclease and polymerase domains